MQLVSKTLFVVSALVSAPAAIVIAAPGAAVNTPSHWQGTGKTYDLNGVVSDTYTLDMVNTPNEQNGEQSTVRIVLSSGTAITMNCTIENGVNKWQKTCDDGGSGGGYLFAFGLGQDYYKTTDGKAYATQIIFDDATHMRLERTELDANNQAQKFYAESLTLVTASK